MLGSKQFFVTREFLNRSLNIPELIQTEMENENEQVSGPLLKQELFFPQNGRSRIIIDFYRSKE